MHMLHGYMRMLPRTTEMPKRIYCWGQDQIEANVDRDIGWWWWPKISANKCTSMYNDNITQSLNYWTPHSFVKRKNINNNNKKYWKSSALALVYFYGIAPRRRLCSSKQKKKNKLKRFRKLSRSIRWDCCCPCCYHFVHLVSQCRQAVSQSFRRVHLISSRYFLHTRRLKQINICSFRSLLWLWSTWATHFCWCSVCCFSCCQVLLSVLDYCQKNSFIYVHM